jgi:hypothetical protein
MIRMNSSDPELVLPLSQTKVDENRSSGQFFQYPSVWAVNLTNDKFWLRTTLDFE